MLGFTDDTLSTMLGQYQEAKWIGGKKNDLVICFGMSKKANVKKDKPAWVYVFGWTEKELVKKNIVSELYKGNLGSKLNYIENEIEKNYEIKEWEKLNYISITPPTWGYIVLIIVMIITQVGYYIWAHQNEYTGHGIHD